MNHSVAACSQALQVTLSFGNKAWPIKSDDMNGGQISEGSSICLGSIFDLTAGTQPGSGKGPGWIVGDTFLVRLFPLVCIM